MIASDANDVWISVITSAFLFTASLIGIWVQNRKTRRKNTDEHLASAAERRANREAVLLAISLVHDEVKDVKGDVTVIRTEQQVIKGDLQAHLDDHNTGVVA